MGLFKRLNSGIGDYLVYVNLKSWSTWKQNNQHSWKVFVVANVKNRWWFLQFLRNKILIKTFLKFQIECINFHEYFNYCIVKWASKVHRYSRKKYGQFSEKFPKFQKWTKSFVLLKIQQSLYIYTCWIKICKVIDQIKKQDHAVT